LRAITVLPETPNSIRLDDVPEPPSTDGSVLVQALALGVCGTDREIIAGEFGAAPDGHDRLILGHESLGRVIAAPEQTDLAPGDHVVGIVRHPDPLPCPACASGQWDMCRNGQYTEHGIKGLNGFGAERWRTPPQFAVKVDRALGLLGVLLEPASVVAKAWDHVDRVWRLEAAPPRRALITGAGPIGLLAALMGMQRRHEVHVFDRNDEGPKPELTHALGAAYHSGGIEALAPLAPDVVIECTGAPAVIGAVLSHIAGRRHLPCRRRRLASCRLQHGPVQPKHGVEQRHRVRHCQRQPASLPDGGREPRPRRPRLAGTTDYTPRAARAFRRGVRAPQG
jgi:threonine dehydrogenase-like Zn-dependent dehydrogenase